MRPYLIDAPLAEVEADWSRHPAGNHERHAKLQKFMLANDSATVAVEVPIWLDEDDIAALEAEHGIVILPRIPANPARPNAVHRSRIITGHIHFLQVRNGAVHILDYKPDARTNPPSRG